MARRLDQPVWQTLSILRQAERVPSRKTRVHRADAEPLLVRHIVQEVSRRQGDPAALCRGLGFGLCDLERVDFRVSYAQTGRVIQRALQSLDDPALPLRLGSSSSLVSWGLCLVGMMAAANPREALDFAIDFLPPSDRFLHLQKQVAGHEFSALAEPAHEDEPEIGHFLVEHVFAALARVCRYVVAPWYGPQRVELRREIPADTRCHEEAFGCPVHFGCSANRLVYELIDHPIATADAIVARMCRHQLEQRAGAGAPSELEAVIVRALRTDLRSPPSMAEIAATVNISERTLRRRLLLAELSYAALLDQERMRRALALLSGGEAPMARVAEAAGFSDTRSLRRAIKRWTGQTPSQLRRHGD